MRSAFVSSSFRNRSWSCGCAHCAVYTIGCLHSTVPSLLYWACLHLKTSLRLAILTSLHQLALTMDGKDAIFATQPHIRDAFKMPNFDKPPVKTVTVSAAGLFKSQKLHTRLQPGSHSTQKSTSRRTNRKKEAEEEVHPLALTFKGASRLMFTKTQLTSSCSKK